MSFCLTNWAVEGFYMRLIVAFFFLCLIFSAAAQDTPARTADPLTAAKNEFRAGNYERALAMLDQIDKTQKATADVLDLRGSIYLEQGRLADAEKTFRAAIELDSNSFSAQLHLGDALLREKKFTAARDVWAGSLRQTEVRSAREKLRYAILLTYLQTNDKAGGERSLERIKFPTETPAYYYAQAAWEFANGHSSEARKWIKAAKEMFNSGASAWFQRPFYDFGWLSGSPPRPTP
jgi:tetratricopeptide (TPR) repeat protein